MLIILILFIAVWGSAAIDMAMGFSEYASEMTVWEKVLLCLIVVLGAPFVIITKGIELLLDLILPEGWDDNDDDKKY